MEIFKKGLFGRDELARIVKETLPSIPPDHNKAIAGIVTSEGAKFVISMGLGQDKSWKLIGAYEHEWTGEDKMAVEVFRTWKS